MERKILFKAKRKDNKKWVKGYYAKWNNKHVIYDIKTGNEREVIPETVCQYITTTRIGDLYEGDIGKRILGKGYNKDYDWADFWLLEWLEDDLCFTTTLIANNSRNGLIVITPRRNRYSKRFDEIDVLIGNIYDDPNILEKMKESLEF